jgi:CBS domain-containing protein
MRKNFSPVYADEDVHSVIREFAPESAGVFPVLEDDGRLLGILEAHDLLKLEDGPVRERDVARRDYVVAHLGETVDEVTRQMLTHNVENVVVVQGKDGLKPIGIARAADILRLRRWIIEEESYESP